VQAGWHIFVHLLRNAAEIGIFIMIVNYIYRYTVHIHKPVKQWLTGLLFGMAGILSMQFPFPESEGVLIDLKVVIAAMAVMIGSVRGGIAAVALICGYCFLLGGLGWPSGIGSTAIAALLAVAFRRMELKSAAPFRIVNLILFGLLLAIQTILWSVFMPAEVTDSILRTAALPLLIIFPAAMAVFKQLAARPFYPGVHPFLAIVNLNTVSSVTPPASSVQRTAVMLVHIDNFKNMNDLYGYAFGEKLLLHMHERIREQVSRPVLLRYGMNRFLVCLRENTPEAGELQNHLVRLRKELSLPYRIQAVNVTLTFTVGIAGGNEHKDTLETLIHQGESALALAMDKGHNQTIVYIPDMADQIVYRSQTQEALRHALERDEFVLHMQPQFEAHCSRFRGFEALLRWEHPRLGTISPEEFIPMAEKSGDIIAIGDWVLHEACAVYKNEVLPFFPDGTMSVNISAVQLADPAFPDKVAQILKETGLPPERLELEITETALIASVETAGACMTRLEQIGVRFALDDFGTGYSSLNYLRMFPIHLVKIDKSFIQEINSGKSHITESIIQFVHMLNLPVAAEGLESTDQYDMLRSWKCDIVQGYLLSKPFPAAELKRFMAETSAR
jgi:diguanylate cyclase (GGDEF)-like protein